MDERGKKKRIKKRISVYCVEQKAEMLKVGEWGSDHAKEKKSNSHVLCEPTEHKRTKTSAK